MNPSETLSKIVNLGEKFLNEIITDETAIGFGDDSIRSEINGVQIEFRYEILNALAKPNTKPDVALEISLACLYPALQQGFCQIKSLIALFREHCKKRFQILSAGERVEIRIACPELDDIATLLTFLGYFGRHHDQGVFA